MRRKRRKEDCNQKYEDKGDGWKKIMRRRQRKICRGGDVGEGDEGKNKGQEE